jgi:uncharacterized membrane protein
MDSKTRSIIKSLTWRIIAVINGCLVAYLFLGNISQSLCIGIVGNVTGFILYYLHERIWNKVNWGNK